MIGLFFYFQKDSSTYLNIIEQGNNYYFVDVMIFYEACEFLLTVDENSMESSISKFNSMRTKKVRII